MAQPMTKGANSRPDAAGPKSQARYALYFAPEPGSALWRFGSEALGYDAATGEALPQPPVPGLSADDLYRLTEDPRRYGFHATLKPPMRLSRTDPGAEAAFLAAVQDFAARRAPFDLPDLAVNALGSFLALTPPGRPAALHDLADACVRDFDPWRAPMDDAEKARRGEGLDPVRAAHLERWGYPHVFESFRFHMTLSGRADSAEREILRAALAKRFAPLAGPVRVDALTVFVQPDPSSRFRILAQYPFGG